MTSSNFNYIVKNSFSESQVKNFEETQLGPWYNIKIVLKLYSVGHVLRSHAVAVEIVWSTAKDA